MKAISVLLPLTFLLLMGCQSKEVAQSPPLTHTLNKIDEYEIEIDSVTAGNFLHYQHLKHEGKEFFTFLNRVNQEINFYDLTTRKLAFKVPVKSEGPDGVGNLKGFNSGYYIHNLDSIFILNRETVRLSVINSQSQKIGEVDLSRGGYLPTAVIAPFAPMYILDNEAYLLNIQGGIKHFEKNKSFRAEYATVVDLSNEQQQYFLSYPESYVKGIWGFDLYRLSWIIDHDKESVVVSYPLEDQLYEYDLYGNLRAKHAASSDKITPAKSLRKNELNTQGVREHYAAQGKYGELYFDPVRRIYLRNSISAISESSIESGRLNEFERPIIMLDENLQKIGEYNEPSKNLMVMFFNEQGIHKYVRTQNENSLKFEVYELATL